MWRHPEVRPLSFGCHNTLFTMWQTVYTSSICCVPCYESPRWGCRPVVIVASDRSKQGGPLQWAHPFENTVKPMGLLDSWVKLRCHVLPHRLLSPSCTDLSRPGCPRVVAVLVLQNQNTVLLSKRRCPSTMSHFPACQLVQMCVWSFIHTSRTRVLEPFYSALFSARPWRGQASTQRSRLRTVVISEWLQHQCLL